eukprot:365655-Chlamydomonas_euryale.AAC.7
MLRRLCCACYRDLVVHATGALLCMLRGPCCACFGDCAVHATGTLLCVSPGSCCAWGGQRGRSCGQPLAAPLAAQRHTLHKREQARRGSRLRWPAALWGA